MVKYSQSPLPFQGQKRNFVKEFKNHLKYYSEEYVFVDLFGGSGLLSHTVKSIFPTAKVVYNDFDNFKQRLNAIESTNKIVAELRCVLKDYPRCKRITGARRDDVLKLLKQANNNGYVDWITLSSSLKFSMNYGTCLKDFTCDTLYNKVRLSDYNADGYLQGVKVVCGDYKALFEEYKNVENVVFLVDPPYLSTGSATYNSDDYWKLRDYLDVLQVLTNQNYFYFTSNKSQIVDLCEWISITSSTANPFAYAKRTTINTSPTGSAKYTDIMYHYKKIEIKKLIKQKIFINKEVDINKLRQDYAKLQRMDKKRLS